MAHCEDKTLMCHPGQFCSCVCGLCEDEARIELMANTIAEALPPGPFHVIAHHTEYPPDAPIQVEELPVAFEPILPPKK